MKHRLDIAFRSLTLVLALLAVAFGPSPLPAAGPDRFEAEAAQVNPERVLILDQDTFPSRRGAALKPGLTSNVGSPQAAPDLVFTMKAPKPGRFWIRSQAAVDAQAAEAMRKAATKHASLRLMIAVGESRPTSRVVFVPWSPPGNCTQALGKFEFDGQEQQVRVWLPAGVRLDLLELAPYTPPKVPADAQDYRPAVVPPASHPRLWVNATSLPKVRTNLTQGENAPVWEKLRQQAAKPFPFDPQPDTEISYSAALEQAAAAKAFVHLMTGDPAPGLEAVALMRGYLSAVAFDNLLDITREVGRAIYTGSLVYDWCQDVMQPGDRDVIHRNLTRLADDMEIGWPPFLQSIVNGHGNEAQVNRDLLAMSIAIYDQDPVPYRYCAYRILEELVPMRRFEYQSPRHNQGISYGPYRFGWDLHAAWLFRRMCGHPVFDDNISNVYHFWLHMRLPNGQMLRDGDGFADGRPANLGATPLLASAYSSDPLIKGDLQRQSGSGSDPLLFLLLNDPAVKAEKDLGSLPLTKDFGPVLGSMVARTGWNQGPNTGDVVVEMKGGGYHFGNHQHSDAGSFQIYYRGLQAVDLGQYGFYGTPYDSNFNKRSIAHSQMLAVDPDEQFGIPSNDGGTRFVRSCPPSPERAIKEPLFANGTIVSSNFGPNLQRPFFSYFSVDLKSTYSAKIQGYVRTFCFLNLDNADTPAALVVLDHMTTAKPEFRKYWQINALNPPERTPDGIVLRNSDLGQTGRVKVRMLLPKPADRNLEVLSGAAANSVFGQPFTPPFPDKPEARGHRVMFSPKQPRTTDTFLTVLTMAGEAPAELPLALDDTPETFALSLAERLVVLSRTGKLLEQRFSVRVPAGTGQQVLLCGLAPGAWSIQGPGGKARFNASVAPGKNTIFLVLPGGDYTVQPGALAGAAEVSVPPDLAPALSAGVPGTTKAKP